MKVRKLAVALALAGGLGSGVAQALFAEDFADSANGAGGADHFLPLVAETFHVGRD